jgi:hypothetical protein
MSSCTTTNARDSRPTTPYVWASRRGEGIIQTTNEPKAHTPPGEAAKVVAVKKIRWAIAREASIPSARTTLFRQP